MEEMYPDFIKVLTESTGCTLFIFFDWRSLFCGILVHILSPLLGSKPLKNQNVLFNLSITRLKSRHKIDTQ